MREIANLIERLAPLSVTLTVLGETGTGKDVVARTIHAQGPRSSAPFVVFDCGSVAANLVESELFGHERGSFTGAVATHIGAFERAHGGTLFLDEIGELPVELQPRLLRALENREVRRVGGTTVRNIDARVIAATNRDLRHEVSAGRFREDLYFRLAGACIQMPNLRARLSELPTLVVELLEDLGSPGVVLTEEAMECLRTQPWPGNIRELKNVLGTALVFQDNGSIEKQHLRFHNRDVDADRELDRLPLGGQPLHRLEKAAIRQTMTRTLGNKARAAELLGIAVSTLYEKLRRYELMDGAPSESTAAFG